MDRILSKSPIGLKLAGSFIFIVLILAASLSLSYVSLGQLNQKTVELYFDHTLPIQNLGEAQALLGQIKSNLQLYLQIPQPKNNPNSNSKTPQCEVCHLNETNGTHHLLANQAAGETTRCLSCHASQATDALHGRSTTNMTSGQDCATCHPAEVITQQHLQVEADITAEVKRVNEIIAAYRQNPLLTAEEKTELAQFDTAWNNYQRIVLELLAQAKSGEAQETLHRVVGGDAWLGQQEVEASINRLVTILQQLAHQSQASSVQTFNTSVQRLLLAGLLGILLAAGLGFAITRNLQTPIEAIARGLQNLRQGNLNWDIPLTVQENLLQRSDEIGHAGEGLAETVEYLQEMAVVANQIASGDLTVEYTLRGNQDELGLAFAKMITSLQALIKMVAQNADKLNWASGQLATAASQSEAALSLIASTLQQVTQGITQEAEGVSKTSGSVEEMNRSIQGVARGAEAQGRASQKAAQAATQIGPAIEQVTSNVQVVTQNSAESAKYSHAGTQTVRETLTVMEVIRSKVNLSATKVEELGTRSEEIGAIIETIEDIASQTNLLALNAAIEAARAEGSGKQATEKLVQTHLVSVAELLAEMLCLTANPLSSANLGALAERIHVETLSIANADGVIISSSQADALGFRFPEQGQTQAAAFRPLLEKDDGVVVQPILAREADGKPYLFVGVSRRDQAGLIQAGMPAQLVTGFGDISRGFAVVAEEVRKLAERSSLSTKEVGTLIKSIQKTVGQAVNAMKESETEVAAGVMRANSAGVVLDQILAAAEAVYRQAEEAGTAAAKVSTAAGELVEAVDLVSAVVEENMAATEEMTANSNALTRVIENIASISEKNSAAVEEVSASTAEIAAQVKEVADSAAAVTEMSLALQKVVAQFKLNES